MNPKDKNGNVLNVGDHVVYMKGTPDEDFGVITKFDDTFCNGTQRVYSFWSDPDCKLETHTDPDNIELVESPVTSDTFTSEDEAMLQKLLAKKEKASKLRDDTEKSLCELVDEMYEVSKGCTLHLFVIENIDGICATLQAYKQHCV